VKSVTKATYLTFSESEFKARFSLTLEIMWDKFLGLCKDSKEMFIDTIPLEMLDWNEETKKIDKYMHKNKGNIIKDKISCFFYTTKLTFERWCILYSNKVDSIKNKIFRR
jgi:hypothetical protein